MTRSAAQGEGRLCETCGRPKPVISNTYVPACAACGQPYASQESTPGTQPLWCEVCGQEIDAAEFAPSSEGKPAEAAPAEPWAYAIETPGGDWYDGEYAVFSDLSSARDQVECLNDDIEEGKPEYKVVPLYRAAPALEGQREALQELLVAAKWAVYALEHGSSIEVHWLHAVAKEPHTRALAAIAKAEELVRAESRAHKEMEEMSERKKFRLRGPCMAMENTDVPAALREPAWREAIEWISRIKWERVDSFRLQVNFTREPRPGEK